MIVLRLNPIINQPIVAIAKVVLTFSRLRPSDPTSLAKSICSAGIDVIDRFHKSLTRARVVASQAMGSRTISKKNPPVRED